MSKSPENTICWPTLVKRWASVGNAGPTLNQHLGNVLCLVYRPTCFEVVPEILLTTLWHTTLTVRGEERRHPLILPIICLPCGCTKSISILMWRLVKNVPLWGYWWGQIIAYLDVIYIQQNRCWRHVYYYVSCANAVFRGLKCVFTDNNRGWSNTRCIPSKHKTFV